MPTPQENTTAILSLMLKNVCQTTKEPDVVYRESAQQFIAKVMPEDQGRCVGKKGINFWAMSTIIWWVGSAQMACPASIRLLEPQELPPQRPKPPFRPPMRWDQIDTESLGRLLDAILTSTFKAKQPWVIERQNTVGSLEVSIRLPKYLQTPMNEPDYAEALSVYLHTVGMVRGLNIQTSVSWA